MFIMVWCRGLTTCRLHVPPFGNRFLNTSWAVGLTYWIVYIHFIFIIYVLIHHIIFWLYFYFLNILYFLKYTCTNIFHRSSLCTFYMDLKVIWEVLYQKQISRVGNSNYIPLILWDIITHPCLWNLLLAILVIFYDDQPTTYAMISLGTVFHTT